MRKKTPVLPQNMVQLTFVNDQNETFSGTMMLDDEVGTAKSEDQQGASYYVIAVILVYGLSIVFMIASYMFMKHKEQKRDGDNEQQVNSYLRQMYELREKTTRENYRRLKYSIIPLIAIGVGNNMSSLHGFCKKSPLDIETAVPVNTLQNDEEACDSQHPVAGGSSGSISPFRSSFVSLRDGTAVTVTQTSSMPPAHIA